MELLDGNGKHAQFKILPRFRNPPSRLPRRLLHSEPISRYKVKSEGDVVSVGDFVALESLKSPSQYLHASRTTFPDTCVYHERSPQHALPPPFLTHSHPPQLRTQPLRHPLRLLHQALPLTEGKGDREGASGGALSDPDYSANNFDAFKGGSLIRLFHKELEGYIAAEGVFGEDIVENGSPHPPSP